jgi:DNA-binding transcriptional ArsR family regulator
MLRTVEPIWEMGAKMQAAGKREGKRLTTALATATAHPLRAKILTILAERVASPVEISREIDEDVAKVGYHVTALAETGLIEEVRQRPVRGAVEHFYRATQLPVITAEQEAERSYGERRSFAETTVSIYCANFAHSLETGALLARGDHHLTRHALNVDDEGWDEMASAYMELFEKVYEIQEAAAERMEKGDEEPTRVVSYLSMFEIPKL